MNKLECPYCNDKVDLDKKLTFLQKRKNKLVEKMVKRQGLEMPEHKDYYCNCKAHLTIAKIKGNWIVVTGSEG